MKYIIATRGSKLALWQTEMVQRMLQEKHPQHEWQIQTVVTTGDRILDRPLLEFGGKGVFLKEIEEALLQKKADLAVHSLKDVPGIETPELQLTAFLQREDPRDVWVSKQDEMMHLAPGKKVGTSSLRRTLLVRFFRPDLQVELLRGNLDTRLRRLVQGEYDAIVVAAAGLHRLNFFDDSYMHTISEDAFIPAIGQGIITIQTRKDDTNLNEIISQSNDPVTSTAARIERDLLARFEGGCFLPIGALATSGPESWRFRAFLGGAKSGRIIQEVFEEKDPNLCASRMYVALQQGGAEELLAELK